MRGNFTRSETLEGHNEIKKNTQRNYLLFEKLFLNKDSDNSDLNSILSRQREVTNVDTQRVCLVLTLVEAVAQKVFLTTETSL